MGQSLEHHLEAVFRAYGIAYVRGAVTENNQRPDFLFPSEEAYWAAPEVGHPCLTMLAAKSTCKDRWRQVLVEAAKIPRKHLLTLEPGISSAQTTQMENSDLQLVVPQAIQESLHGWAACLALVTCRVHSGTGGPSARVSPERCPIGAAIAGQPDVYALDTLALAPERQADFDRRRCIPTYKD